MHQLVNKQNFDNTNMYGTNVEIFHVCFAFHGTIIFHLRRNREILGFGLLL